MTSNINSLPLHQWYGTACTPGVWASYLSWYPSVPYPKRLTAQKEKREPKHIRSDEEFKRPASSTPALLANVGTAHDSWTGRISAQRATTIQTTSQKNWQIHIIYFICWTRLLRSDTMVLLGQKTVRLLWGAPNAVLWRQIPASLGSSNIEDKQGRLQHNWEKQCVRPTAPDVFATTNQCECLIDLFDCTDIL